LLACHSFPSRPTRSSSTGFEEILEEELDLKTISKTFHKFELTLRAMDLTTLLLVSLFLVWTFLSLSVHAETSTVSTSSKETLKSTTKDLTSSDFDGSWHLYLLGLDSKDEFNQATLTLMRLDLTTNYSLVDWLKLNVSPSIKSTSGHSQTEKDAGTNTDSLVMRNASADFLLSKSSVFSAGALNQAQMHSSLLMSDRAFPALRVSIQPESSKGLHFGLFAQSAVPTSASLSTNTKDFEATPSFQSAGAQLNYQSSSLLWKNSLNGYEYRNLPTSVATESGLFGNTVYTTNSTDAAFVYNYRGIEASTELRVDWTPRLATVIAGTGIQNSAAPQGLNQGYLLTGAVDYMVSSKLTLTPMYKFFRVEPDATVAYYSDARFDANRVGYRLALQGSFSKRFAIRVGGGERDAIYQNALQSRERFYELGLETFDAKF
jgi:hypothetical protein